MWKKVVEKVINVKVKASLQPPFKTKEIDSRYPKSYKPLAKKDKNEANQEHGDRDKNIAKSHNLSLINTNLALDPGLQKTS